jgi:hypothetical protein
MGSLGPAKSSALLRDNVLARRDDPLERSQKRPFLRLMRDSPARLAKRHKNCCNTYLEIKVSKPPA